MASLHHLATIAALLALVPSGAPSTVAETYPSRPVTPVVPFPAGGSTDWLSRLLGQQLEGRLNTELKAIVGEPEVIRDINSRGSIAIATPPPDELKRYVETEIVRWSKVVEQAGAKGTE